MTETIDPNIIPLPQLRQQIDTLDLKILELLNQRAHCAMKVAKTKIATNDKTTSFYRPDREALVLRRIQVLNKGPLSNEAMVSFFREIMSACLALEKPLKVAFLGPEGTFTQQAVFKHFGHAVDAQSVRSISDIFNSVEIDYCQFGVVPIENSTEGVIAHTLDCFLTSSLQICGEVEERVHQNLIGNINHLADIKAVLSHQQSLAQCCYWLDTHLPNAKRIVVSSNAEAARLVQQSKDQVAIAGKVAADLYALNIIEKNIEDEPNNTTRFMIIGKQQPESTGLDKTSLLLSINNKSGALHKILEPFAQHDISMTHIESRPSRQGLWDYVFFIDIEGHQYDPNIVQALTSLKSNVTLLNILGSYPKAVI
jgi:chorismate mutase/prephenate dehydratase